MLTMSSAQAAEPAENSTMALRNTRCDPKRSASQPLAWISAVVLVLLGLEYLVLEPIKREIEGWRDAGGRAS